MESNNNKLLLFIVLILIPIRNLQLKLEWIIFSVQNYCKDSLFGNILFFF